MNDSQADPDSPSVPSGVLDRALALVTFLRARCPWDAAQSPASLQRYLLEEAHEVVDAITAGDDPALRDELGDLLLNLAFQIVLAEERGAFSRSEVVAGLEEKMRRRHPHLYGLGEAEPWETLKSRERQARPRGSTEGRAGVLDDVPVGLDPLQRAHRIQERAASVGFDWDDAKGAWDKVREEVEELAAELDARRTEAMAEELGDLLFSLVNFARLSGAHAPTVLSRANAKFIRRFTALEGLAAARGLDVDVATLDQLDELWTEAKQRER